MSDIRQYEMREVLSGATLPIQELSAVAQDGVTPVDLTGYAVTLSFWYPGAAIHFVGQGYISDATNGLAHYEMTGAETPTAGTLYYQWTLHYSGPVNMQAADGQTWGEMTTQPFLRKVIEAAS